MAANQTIVGTIKDTYTPLQRFWKLLQPDRKEVTQIYGYAIFNGLVNLTLPLGIQAIINLIQGGQMATSFIILVSIVIFGVAFSGILQVMQLRITENLQQKIFTRSSFEFSYRIPRIKLSALYGYYAPELMNRFFDTLAVQKGLSKILIDFSIASLQIIFGLLLLSLYHPFFIMFSVFLLIIIALIFRFTVKRGMETSLKESKYKYQVAHWLEELARTNRTFKLAGKTDLPLEKTDANVSRYLEARENHFKVLIQQFSWLVTFKVIVATGLLLIGGILVMEQQINIGQFVAAEIIILLVMSSVEKLIVSFETIYDVLTALEKIGQVTDLELEKEDGVNINKGDLETVGFEVDVREITFSYPGQNRKILDGISMKVDAGQNICLSGKNGSGKSTLLHVIAGLYQPQDGIINFSGFPMSSVNLESLQSEIGACLAEEKLFEGTLTENINVGRKNVKFPEVRWAVNNLGLTDFVKNLPQGYETIIDPDGKKLPRSVVQKILLARAIAGSPSLILMEDALEHIESEERKDIIDFLTDHSNKWTLITVSSDPYFARKCDRVVIMDAGKIVEEGTWDDIIDKK